MGNPPFILVRYGKAMEVPFEEIESEKWTNRAIKVYDFKVKPNDRLVFFSDGISQAGIGSDAFPLGWRLHGCGQYLEELLANNADLSAHELSDMLIREALRKEPDYLAGDDMTAAVMYFRKPRKMLLFTGPPFDRERDKECADIINTYEGDKAICGGTTAEIIARELNRKMTMDLNSATKDLPPTSDMEGVNLVTEGIFTLTRTAQYLEKGSGSGKNDPAGRLSELLLRNDIIEFLVGTRINEAHQDPNLPVDLEIRRNIVKRIADILKQQHLKEVTIKYV
jgi:hypothetical protein